MEDPESDNMWEVEIIKLTDPGRFLARELPGSGKSSSHQEFVDMSERMSEYLNNAMEQGEPPFKATLSEICAAQKGDIWHRLRVDEFIASSNGQRTRCFLVDVGSHVTLNVTRLHRIPAKFKNFPSQIHCCCLSELQPLTMQVSETETGLEASPRPNKKWDPSASTFMSEMIKASTKCKAKTVRKGRNEILHVRLYFLINSKWLCLNDEFVSKKYAIQVDSEESDISNQSCPPLEGLVSPETREHRPGHMMQVTTPDSNDSLEMPALSDFTDSDVSTENYKTLNNNTPKTAHSHRNVLQNCHHQNLSLQLGGSMTERREQFSTHRDSSKISMKSSEIMSGVHRSNNQIPTTGRGRAALLSQAIKKANLVLSSQATNPCSSSSATSPSKPFQPKAATSHKSSDAESSENLSKSTPAALQKSPSKSSSLLSLTSSLEFRSKMSSPTKNQLSIDNYTQLDSPPSLSSVSDQENEENSIGSSRHPMNFEPEPVNTQKAPDMSESLSSHSSEIRDMKRSNEDDDDVIQVLLDGQQSYALGEGIRIRERKLLDDVILCDQGQSRDEKRSKGIVKDKNKHFGQQEGRKFLERLRNRSGLQMISPEEAVPQTKLHSKSQLPRLGTLVYGKAIPMGLYNLEHIPFTRPVKKELMDTFDKDMALGIETFSWPSILRGRHVIGVGKPGQENTLAYIPALVTQLSDKKFYKSVPRGTGPLAVIVVPTWKKVQEVFDVVQTFIGSSIDGNRQIKCIPLYAGGTENDHEIQSSLMKGYEILITTPNSLLRKMDENFVNLKRICHMVVDDIDILLSHFKSEMEHIMQIFVTCVKARGDSNIPQQVLMFSKIWTSEIDSFRQRYTEEPVITFSSRVEASIYGEVKQVVTLSAWNQRLEKFCSLVAGMSPSCQKVIAWTTNVSEAVDMSKALSSQGIYTILAHHEFDSDELMDEVKVRWHEASHSKNLTVLVSTDPCYEDLGITDATTVIHYDIPSRTRFGNRLACMFQHFSDRMSDFQPNMEPVSHILLTEKCPAHARSLLSVLKRTKSTYPRQLEDFVRGYQWGLQNEHGTELCPLMKSFGSCQNDRCELRHVLVPEVDFKTGETTLNDLPASGEVKIRVIEVINSTRFYCHLLQHRPPDSKNYEDKKLAYHYLVLELSLFFSKPSNHVPYLPSGNLLEDGLCGFKDDTGTVDRVKVLEVRDGTHRDPMKQCKVWLVDLGLYKYGTVDQLVKLPRRLADVPYQVIEVYVCRVKPVDHDLEWTKKADIFIENLVKDKELTGRIVLRLGMTLWLDPLVHQVKLKGVGVSNDLVIRQELLGNNFATINPDHIKCLYELCRGKTEIPENIMLQYFDYCLEIEMTQETLPHTQEFHEINMVGIFSPSLFYVQRWDRIAEMDELEDQIDKEVNETLEKEGSKSNGGISLEPGSVCLAESDGKWYRAKILTVKDDGSFYVFHLDYGTKEDVTHSQVLPLRRHLAKLPCQAIECELASVKPSDEDWPPGVVDVMCNFAQYLDEVQKCLVAKVTGRVDSLHTMGQKLVIDVQDASGVTLSEELVWRNQAVSDNQANEIKPLFGKPALKNQLFFNPLDKIPYLCANIYWCEDSVQATELAEELKLLLAGRQKGWDSVLEKRELFQPVVKLIGYIACDEANGIVLKALVQCCKESPRLCQLAVDEYLAFSLDYCIEMVDRFPIQAQALEAVAELVSEDSFVVSACSSELKRTLITFLVSSDKFPLQCQHLQYLCETVSKFLSQETDSQALDSNCENLLNLIYQVMARDNSSDEILEPWLSLLASIVDSKSKRTQRQIMRDKYICPLISLFDQIRRPQCLYHLLTTLQVLVQTDKRNKTILLEHNALFVLKRLMTQDLDYPVRHLCETVCVALNLNFPAPERLAGTRLIPGQEPEKIVAPMVTWTESCFTVALKIRVKNASSNDFTISRNNLQCNVISEAERYVLDWELYGDVVPEKCCVKPYSYYTVVSLKKDHKGKWGRLLKNKTKPFNLNADYERLLNSDEEVDEDRDEDGESLLRKPQKKKGIFDGISAPRLGVPSSDDSSSHDSLVLNSSDDNHHNDPKIDYEAFFHNYKS